jgi:hypothetical protein
MQLKEMGGNMSDDQTLVRRLRCYADIDDAVYNPWVYGEAADRIEKLEAALNCNLPDYDPKIGIVERLRQLGKWRVDGTKSSPIYNKSADHIEKLESALRSIAANACCDSCREAALVARKALEGKDGE